MKRILMDETYDLHTTVEQDGNVYTVTGELINNAFNDRTHLAELLYCLLVEPNGDQMYSKEMALGLARQYINEDYILDPEVIAKIGGLSDEELKKTFG